MARKTKTISQPISEDNDPLFTRKKKGNEPSDDELEMVQSLLPGLFPQEEGPSIEAEAGEASIDEDGKAQEPLSDMEVLAILDVHENHARSFVQDEISIRAAISNEFFLAQPEGRFEQQLPDRSKFVDTSVQDTINWLLPPLMDVFCGNQSDVVRFQERNPAKKKSAQMTTAMVNHVWREQNDYYKICRTWFHDALMAPAGIIKVFWEPDLTPESTDYRGLTDLQYAALALEAESGEFAIVKHRQYANPNYQSLIILQQGQAQAGALALGQQPQQAAQHFDPTAPHISERLHDVVIHKWPNAEKNSRGQIKIINIPLDEFLIDPRARSADDARYAAHQRTLTLSDLRAMGFDADLVDQLSSNEFDSELTATYLTRTELQGAYASPHYDESGDPSMREVTVVESYIKMDYRKTGIAEWRKIIRCGNVVLENDPCDGNPFIMICSNSLPHLAFGISTAEQAQGIQTLQTQLVRSLVDNVSFGANAQMLVDETKVNIPDLMDSRPGGIVRTKDMAAVQVLPTTSGDVGGVTSVMQVLDTLKQERTGVQKLTQGSDADILNETATGYMAMTEKSEQRIKLMCRDFAETGFRPLALRTQKLLAQYQDELMQVLLNGQLVEANPVDANNHFGVDVKVGLGTGDKAREVQGLNQILMLQQTALQQNTGMVTLNHVYNTVEKMVKAMGFANAGEFFQQPPAPMPQPPQPQMSPDMQATLQIEQMKAQASQQKQERQAQLDAMRIQAQAQNDNQQSERAHARELTKLQMQQQTEREKMYLQAAIQREQVALQAMISPQDEAAVFSETFASTTQTLEDALTNINVQVSGEYDKFLQAVLDAPEPDASDQTAIYPGDEDPHLPQE